MSTSAAAPRRAGPGLYPTDTPVVARTTPLASAADGQTSQIIRDLKGMNVALTQALETKGLSEPDVELQRQSLRRRYQTLLFSHHPPPPPSSSSVGSATSVSPAVHPSLPLHVEGLWIQTTHAIIALHRAKITELSGPPGASTSSPGKPNRHVVPPSGRQHLNSRARPVELRKQLTKFRAFLAQEIAFYSALAARFVRSLAVEEARPCLKALGIVVAEGLEDSGRATESAVDKADRALLGRKVVTKVLVCLGDLERYKEMYSERERERKGRIENGKAVVPQDKRFERAKEVYSRARELMPENGNPYNQLAVISTYVHDPFSSTYFYLRSMSIEDPFVAAKGNLQSTLRRPLDKWKAAGRGADVTIGGGEVEEARLKQEVVLLQAMYALKSGRYSHQSAVVLSLFRSLLLSQQLTVETIIRSVVLPFASHWDGLFSRPVPRADKDHARSKINVEAPILEHILDLLSILLDITCVEIKATLTADQKEALASGSVATDENAKRPKQTKSLPHLDKSAQHLTGVVRRVLPALRVISKWLIAHSAYLARASKAPPAYPSPSSSSPHGSLPVSAIPVKIAHLWRTYATCLNVVSVAFPFENLQPLATPLEEDIEMKGFGPLGKRMGEGWAGERRVADGAEDENGLHPNEEMLMRLWDLQTDGRTMASRAEPGGTAAVQWTSGRFSVPGSVPVGPSSPGAKNGGAPTTTRRPTPTEAPTTVARATPPPSKPSPVRASSAHTTPPAPTRPPSTPKHDATRQTPRPVPRSHLPPPPASRQPPLGPAPTLVASSPAAGRDASSEIQRARSSNPGPAVDAETEAEEAALNDGDSGSHSSTVDHELELASVSTETEDDPVNRAMRAALDDDDDENDFDDQHEAETEYQPARPVPDASGDGLVWPVPTTRRDTVTAPTHMLPPRPTTPVATTRGPAPSSGLTAHDLLQKMSSLSSASPSSAVHRPDGSRSSNYLFGSSSNLSSIWGSPGGGPTAPGTMSASTSGSRQTAESMRGSWGSFASGEASRMQDGPGARQAYAGPTGSAQHARSNQFDQPSAPLNQSFSSPELRFSHGTSSNAPPGFPSSTQHARSTRPAHNSQPSISSPPSLPGPHNPGYAQQASLRLPGQPSLPPSSGLYRQQAASPANGFASFTPPAPSDSPSQGYPQLSHRSSPSYGQQQQAPGWGQQQHQQFGQPSAPPGLGQSHQHSQQTGFPPGLQPSYSSPGVTRQNPWG